MHFVKGHMGGNLIILLHGDEMNQPRELEQTLRVLSGKYLTGHQAGILYPPEMGGDLRVRIVSCSWRDYIPACGGLTQVLGKAIGETDIGHRYGIALDEGKVPVTLEFDCGLVPLQLDVKNGHVNRVETNLSSFVEECTTEGIEEVIVDDVPITRVGSFMVVSGEDIAARYRGVDFELMNSETLNVFAALQQRFQEKIETESWIVALYDENTANGGDARALFPHSVMSGHIEAACGTGSVALALGLATKRSGQSLTLTFETGGEPVLGGNDKTTVHLERKGSTVTSATFSHDNVEILAIGKFPTIP